MKRTVIACLLIICVACTHKGVQYNAPITTEKAEFVPHTEDKPMRSYLTMELPYAPYKEVFEELQRRENLILQNRGEAHITVITPVEYDRVLKKILPIDEINKIALQNKIQNSHIQNRCIGVGTATIDGSPERTYFVVIESFDLLKIRRQVEREYLRRGGKSGEFKPEQFFPHVTLGFTKRDLHFEDGVLKDKSSCRFSFKN